MWEKVAVTEPLIQPIDLAVSAELARPTNTAVTAELAKPTYGFDAEGGYTTPYTHVVFYDPTDFFQSAVVATLEKCCAVPYPPSGTDWPGIGQIPPFLAPTCVLFGQVPPAGIESLRQRGFPNVVVYTDDAAFWDIFPYQNAGHYSAIEMLLQTRARAIGANSWAVAGLTFGVDVATAARSFGQLATSGLYSSDNMMRCEQRGIALADFTHWYGRTAAASARKIGDCLVTWVPPVAWREDRVSAAVIEHMSAMAGRCAVVWPSPRKWWVYCWDASGQPPFTDWVDYADLCSRIGGPLI